MKITEQEFNENMNKYLLLSYKEDIIIIKDKQTEQANHRESLDDLVGIMKDSSINLEDAKYQRIIEKNNL